MSSIDQKMDETANSSTTTAIVIHSSDDDDDDNVQEVFKEFVAKVERCVKQKEVADYLNLKFAEASSELVSSSKFIRDLKWRTKLLDNTNAYIQTGAICKLLNTNSDKADSENGSDGGKNVNSSLQTRSLPATREKACNFVNKSVVHVVVDASDETNCTSNVGKRDAALPYLQPSTSKEHSSSASQKPTKIREQERVLKRKAKSSSPPKKNLSPQKRKRLVRKLEEKLKHVDGQIRLLSQAEMSLEEMDMAGSTYIQESRLKARFNQIWKKICKLQGRAPDTGRVTEKKVKCQSTGYPEIDFEVNKFLKRRRGKFPDTFDIKNVVSEANKKHCLNLATAVIEEISGEVFCSIGNKLQKRRKKDFEINFGCFLTDDVDPSNDPALTSTSLHQKLEENRKISKRALDEEFKKYVLYGRMKPNDDNCSSSDNDSDRSVSKKKLTIKVKQKYSGTELSDSSDNECEDFDLEETFDKVSDTRATSPSSSKKIVRSPSQDFQEKTKRTFSVTELFDSSDNEGAESTNTVTSNVVTGKNERKAMNVHDSCKNNTLRAQSDPRNSPENGSREGLRNNCNMLGFNDTKHNVVSCVPDRVESHHKSTVEDDSTITSQTQSNVIPAVVTADNVDETIASSCQTAATVSVEDREENMECRNVQENSSFDAAHFKEYQLKCSSPMQAKDVESCGGHNTIISDKHELLSAKTSCPATSSSSLPANLKMPLSSLTAKKRKADIATSFESPLKIVCSTRLQISGEDHNSSEEQIANGTIPFSKSDSNNGAGSIISETSVTGPLSRSKQKRLKLSLNRSGRKSPLGKGKACPSQPDVIVLSDDDDNVCS